MDKHAVTFYLTPEQRNRLRLAARIAGTPVTEAVEKLVADWLERNKATIDQAASLIGKLKLG